MYENGEDENPILNPGELQHLSSFNCFSVLGVSYGGGGEYNPLPITKTSFFQVFCSVFNVFVASSDIFVAFFRVFVAFSEVIF